MKVIAKIIFAVGLSIFCISFTLKVNPNSKPVSPQLREMSSKERTQQIPDSITNILRKHQCLACHREKERLIGPSFADIALKNYSPQEMLKLIKNPQPTNWPGYPAMPPMETLSEEEVNDLALWMMTLKKD